MKAPLLMIGVGGCGHSMVEGLIGHSFSADVDYVVVDTVAVNASASFPFRMLSIGSDLTKGRGTGGNVALATTIAEANGPLLAELLTERQLIILLTGLGGGAGSGISPVIAKLAAEQQATLITIAIWPFPFEAGKRTTNAQQALTQLSTLGHATLVIENKQLLAHVGGATRLSDAFGAVSQLLALIITQISRMLFGDALIRVDITTLTTVLAQRGQASIGYCRRADLPADTPVTELARTALAHPLSPRLPLHQAKALVLAIRAGAGFDISELNAIGESAVNMVSANCAVAISFEPLPDVADDELEVFALVGGIT